MEKRKILLSTAFINWLYAVVSSAIYEAVEKESEGVKVIIAVNNFFNELEDKKIEQGADAIDLIGEDLQQLVLDEIRDCI